MLSVPCCSRKRPFHSYFHRFSMHVFVNNLYWFITAFPWIQAVAIKSKLKQFLLTYEVFLVIISTCVKLFDQNNESISMDRIDDTTWQVLKTYNTPCCCILAEILGIRCYTSATNSLLTVQFSWGIFNKRHCISPLQYSDTYYLKPFVVHISTTSSRAAADVSITHDDVIQVCRGETPWRPDNKVG